MTICVDCKERPAIHRRNDQEPLCELCSTDDSKYEQCSSCGLFFPFGQLYADQIGQLNANLICEDCDD